MSSGGQAKCQGWSFDRTRQHGWCVRAVCCVLRPLCKMWEAVQGRQMHEALAGLSQRLSLPDWGTWHVGVGECAAGPAGQSGKLAGDELERLCPCCGPVK